MKMVQRISPSKKLRKVSASRDLPHVCTAQSTVKTETRKIGSDDVAVITETREKCVDVAADHNHNRPKEVESIDLILRKAGFNTAGANCNVGNGTFLSGKRKSFPYLTSKVQPLSSEEAIKLMASQSKRRHCYGNIQSKRPLLAKDVQKQLSNAAALRLRAHKPSQHRGFSPRKKVEEVLRVFKLVFKELDRDKLARGGATGRIDCMTRTILMEMGMQVNSQKMIGPVPGIEVGLELQFKAELSLVGLHFDIMGGIDYMKKGNMELATSIVSSEGNGYRDRFDDDDDDVMIYCGQGGNTTSKDPRVIRDQKLVTGNLALANSMREKSPVRVIRGKRRLDQRGMNYVYDGLYMVENYWRERGPQGYIMFKFKLCRIPGQPYVHL